MTVDECLLEIERLELLKFDVMSDIRLLQKALYCRELDDCYDQNTGDVHEYYR